MPENPKETAKRMMKLMKRRDKGIQKYNYGTTVQVAPGRNKAYRDGWDRIFGGKS